MSVAKPQPPNMGGYKLGEEQEHRTKGRANRDSDSSHEHDDLTPVTNVF